MTREKRYRLGKRLVFSLIVAVSVFSLQFVPSGYLSVHPGPVISLSDVVKIEGFSPCNGSFSMVSVVAKDASFYEFLKAAVDRRVGLWSKKDVLGGQSIEEYLEHNKGSMVESQNAAIHVALNAKGVDPSEFKDFSDGIEIVTGQVAGPSAGLAFALEILNSIGPDLVKGRKIACTGILNYEGRVIGVGGVSQKTLACREHGIELFIVPQANYDDAISFAGGMTVVGVRTVLEALDFLSQEPTP